MSFDDTLDKLLVDSRDCLLRIEEHQDHVGTTNALPRADQPVEFDVVGDALSLPDPRRVDGDK